MDKSSITIESVSDGRPLIKGTKRYASPLDMLEASADTFRERHEMYGSNWDRVGATLFALFPDGLHLKTLEDFNRFHIFLLLVMKHSRYAVNFERGGHQDSLHDNITYSAILEFIDAEIKAKK